LTTPQSNKGHEKVKWEENAVDILLNFLKKERIKVQQLRRRGAIAKNVRTKLWKDVSIILQNNGYKYSSKQCSVKWKNIKKNYKVILFSLIKNLAKEPTHFLTN